MKMPHSILVFRSCGLGDFILSAPGFHALRKRFPDSRITLLTLHTTDREIAKKVAIYAGGSGLVPWVELLRPHLIDDVIVLDDPKSLRAFLKARSTLSNRKFDLIVQMIDVGTPWRRRLKKIFFIMSLTGFVSQVGWRRKGVVEKGRIPKSNQDLGHHVFGPLQFAAEIGEITQPIADVFFDVRPGRQAELWTEEWLSRNHSVGRRLVAFAPGAIHGHKNWPVERFVELARRILHMYSDVDIVVVGTVAEKEKALEISDVDPARITDICGVSSIAQSAALFANCNLVVGNDGGAMHLADAMGAKVISIIPGIEFPNSIEPWHNIENAVRNPVECAPCYSFTYCPLGHNRCMTGITVEAVLEICRKIL